MRSEWRDVSAKSEEIVRQTYIRHLVENYGYSLGQMDQERRTMHGHKSPRADIVCDLIFQVAFGDQPRALPAYVAEVLRTSDLRRQIEERRTGAAPMMQKITKSGLNSLTFPLPPLDDQRALIKALDAGRAEASHLRTAATITRAKAWTALDRKSSCRERVCT